MMFLFLLSWLVFGGLIAWWANEWGRNWLAWGGLSLLLSPLIAGIALAVMGEDLEETMETRGTRKCPFCAEIVKVEAIKCKHCGSELPNLSIKGSEYLDEQQLNDLISKIQGKK